MLKQTAHDAELTQVIPAAMKWVDRIAMIRKAIQDEIPLHRIELRLDWLDHLAKNFPKGNRLSQDNVSHYVSASYLFIEEGGDYFHFFAPFPGTYICHY